MVRPVAAFYPEGRGMDGPVLGETERVSHHSEDGEQMKAATCRRRKSVAVSGAIAPTSIVRALDFFSQARIDPASCVRTEAGSP